MSENRGQTKISDFRGFQSGTDLTVRSSGETPNPGDRSKSESNQRKRKSEERMLDDNDLKQKCFGGSANQSTKSAYLSFTKFEKDQTEPSPATSERDDTEDLKKSEIDEAESEENNDGPCDDEVAHGSKDIERDEENPSPSELDVCPDSHEAAYNVNTDSEDTDKEDMGPFEETDDHLYETICSSQEDAVTLVEELPRVSLSNPRKLPTLRSTKNHFVLFENEGKGYLWDERFVRMPCDPKNEMVDFKEKDRNIEKRWNVIKRTYQQQTIRSVFQLESAILKYNGHRRHMWDFQCLRDYFLESRFKKENHTFFDKVLPKIIDCALDMEALFKESIPLLRKNEGHMITMTQTQAACILANAFLCTFPWRNKDKKQNLRLPTINFNSLFNSPTTESRLEKIKCVIHYFERVTENMPDGNITFRRQILYDSRLPDWENTEKKFTQLHVSSEGIIEDNGAGMLQVDFANKFVGGGVIGHGCVQEEIRFMICPEMIVSRLVTEVLNDNEVLIMTGCERFSNYAGYSNTFEWTGDHMDNVERDTWHRKYTEVVAMDAVVVRDKTGQFSNFMVDRELNKAYCAFLCEDKYENKIPAVCTGNWGCGAFGGNKELKALLQLIAASQAGRDVLFLTFHDEEFVTALNFVHSKIKKNSFSTGDVVKRLREFNSKRQFRNSSLFKALKDILV